MAAAARLLGAGLVVDAGLHAAAIVAGLVLRAVGLFFEQDEPRARRPIEDGARRCQPDDAAADDRDVVGHGALLYVITRTTTARGGGSARWPARCAARRITGSVAAIL